MTTIQQLFDKTVDHMRAQGNPWGDYQTRGWHYINPDNPCQRCAQGIHMNTTIVRNKYFHDRQAYDALLDALGPEASMMMLLMQSIFEFAPANTWETRFKELALNFNLAFSSIENSVIEDKEHEQV